MLSETALTTDTAQQMTDAIEAFCTAVGEVLWPVFEAVVEAFTAAWESLSAWMFGVFGMQAYAPVGATCHYCGESLILDDNHGTCVHCGGPPRWWQP